MGITIKRFNKKWKIRIDEEWEFPEDEDFKNVLNQLIQQKAKFGELK